VAQILANRPGRRLSKDGSGRRTCAAHGRFVLKGHAQLAFAVAGVRTSLSLR